MARSFASWGATIIDADELAREAVAPGSDGLAEIVRRWGRKVLLPDESLDRAALRRIVFDDAGERDALNAIVHPRVRALRDQRLAAARERGDHMVVSDIPLLFETGLEGTFDRIVLVDAPEAVRLDRLRRDRGLDEATARQMVEAQMPAEQKRARTHYVIDNDGTREALVARARAVWAALERDARRGQRSEAKDQSHTPSDL